MALRVLTVALWLIHLLDPEIKTPSCSEFATRPAIFNVYPLTYTRFLCSLDNFMGTTLEPAVYKPVME